MKKRILCALLTLSLLAAMAPASLAESEDVWTWTDPKGSGESYTLTITDGNKLSFTGTLGSWHSSDTTMDCIIITGSGREMRPVSFAAPTIADGAFSTQLTLSGTQDAILTLNIRDPAAETQGESVNIFLFADGQGGFALSPQLPANGETKTVGDPGGEFYTYTLHGMEMYVTFRLGAWAQACEEIVLMGPSTVGISAKVYADGQTHTLRFPLETMDRQNVYFAGGSIKESWLGQVFEDDDPYDTHGEVVIYLNGAALSFRDSGSTTVSDELRERVERENVQKMAQEPLRTYRPIDPSVRAKSEEICRGLTSDMDKVRAIHNWVCENTYYDEAALDNLWETGSFGSSQSAEVVLAAHKGVCAGFSTLTQALLDAQGIPSIITTGYAIHADYWLPFQVNYEDYNPEISHTWNEALVDGRWVTLDTTWDCLNTYNSAGEWEKLGIRWDYFDPNSAAFSKDHRVLRRTLYGQDVVPAHVSSVGFDPVEGGSAIQTVQVITVDGKSVELQAYAITDGSSNTNYVRVRDLAHVLDGTASQFNVSWNGAVNLERHTAYTSRNGQEGQVPYSGRQSYTVGAGSALVDGQTVEMTSFVITDAQGGGHTYYKLRDLGQALGFNVGWSKDTGIFIEPEKYYTGVN